ncbi:unnamed protein product [Alopecurus aequalis]
MPRRKLMVKYIVDAKKRELTYKKRLQSLVKKISQLSALCGVDILFTDLKRGTAGAGGVTTWPPDRGAVNKLVARFREMPPEMIRENLNIGTYLQGELDKEERKLVKVRQCTLDNVLTLWDPRLDDLPAHDLVALHHAMGEKLESARQRSAELSSVPTSVVTATEPAPQHAPAFPGNAFDLNLSDTGSSVGAQDCYYLPPDILPQPVPVQSHYTGFQFQMHPPCIAFGAPMPFMPFPTAAPPELAAPLGYSFTGGGANIMDPLPAATAGFYDDFAMQGLGQGFAARAALAYNQEFLTYRFDDAGLYGFDAAGTRAGYDLQPRGVWPLGAPNNPADTAAYELQNDVVMWSDNGHALGEQEEPSWLRLFHGRM